MNLLHTNNYVHSIYIVVGVRSKPLDAYHAILFAAVVCSLTVSMEKAMASHSSTLAWKILWTEEPGGLQSMGSLRVGHD